MARKRRKPMVKGSAMDESLSRQRRAIVKTLKLLTRQIGGHLQSLADACVLADARLSRRKIAGNPPAAPARPVDWKGALAAVKAASAD